MTNDAINRIRLIIDERIEWLLSEKNNLMNEYSNSSNEIQTMIEALTLSYGMEIEFLNKIKSMIF